MTATTAASRPHLGQRLSSAWRRLRGGTLTPLRAALSVAVGLFVGAIPVYGFQLLIVLAVCVPTRLDAALAYVAANVSNPVTLPLLLLIEVEIGALLLTGDHAVITTSLDPERLVEYGTQLLVGAPTLAALLALAGGVVAWTIAGRARHGDAFQAAVERTLARYAGGLPKDRMYARAKLEIDPLARSIASLEAPLGRLVDAGCGLGQLGLVLLELGRVEQLTGFDPDERAIAIARDASPEGSFSVDGFESFVWRPADTVLFADTLHYASLDTQDSALAGAARCLAPGGRLIVRDVDARPGWRSLVTRLGEHASAVLRRRGSAHAYRSTADLMTVLRRLGLEPRVLPDAADGPFDNPVVIANKPRPEGTESS